LADELHGYVRWVRPMDDWVREVGKGFEQADRRGMLDLVWDWIRGLFRRRPDTIRNIWQDYYTKYNHLPVQVATGPFHTQAIAVLSALQVISAERPQWTTLRLILQDTQRALNQVIASIDRFSLAVFIFRPLVNFRDILERLGGMRSILLPPMEGTEYYSISEGTEGTGYHSIYEGTDWKKGSYLQLDPESLGRAPTMQDLAAVIEQMYRKWDEDPGRKGIDDSVQIVKVGPHEWAVFVIGTDTDYFSSQGLNNWRANLYAFFGIPSRYELFIKQQIEKLPEGDKINLIGHSQGAYVVMNLADNQSIVDRYKIASVTTFAGDGLPPSNSRLDDKIYHNYVFEDDLIRIFGKANPFGKVSPIPGEKGKGHSDYHLSEYLEGIAAPFSVNQWSSTFYNENDIRNGTNTIPWDIAGGEDIPALLNSPTRDLIIATIPFLIMYGYGQKTIAELTEKGIIPQEWRIKIDRVYDAWGEAYINPELPTMSKAIAEELHFSGELFSATTQIIPDASSQLYGGVNDTATEVIDDISSAGRDTIDAAGDVVDSTKNFFKNLW